MKKQGVFAHLSSYMGSFHWAIIRLVQVESKERLLKRIPITWKH